MKKVLSLLAILAMVLTVGCSKVPAGNVGVKVYLLGGDKGVDQEVLGTGRYYIGINEDLFLFPTFSQNYVWTQEPTEGSKNDESLTFGTKEGLSVGADVGITYSIDPDRVADVFQKYRKGVDEITDVYLRNMVRDALVKSASTKSVESIYGVGKADLMKEVEDAVRDQVSEIGIIIERVYWVGDLRLPDSVVASINAKIDATQKAIETENKVRTAIAQADIVRATAKGDADAKIENARAEAESILLKGTAEAEAIKLRAEALAKNENLVELTKAERWNGVLPTTMLPNSAVPFIETGK